MLKRSCVAGVPTDVTHFRGRYDNFIPMPSDDFQPMGPPVGISDMFLGSH
jgi:hypothetical protein